MATGKDMDMGNEGEGREGLGREPTASEVMVSVNSGAAATLSCELTAAGSGANTRLGRSRSHHLQLRPRCRTRLGTE